MKKKFLSILMASVLTFTMPLTAFAEGTTSYGNGDNGGSITVTANVKASYSITLPTTIELDLQPDGTYAKDYTVGVKANIPAHATVKVIPTPTFTMQKVDGAVEDVVNASVTQTVQTWVDPSDTHPNSDEMTVSPTTYANTTGRIVATGFETKQLGTSYRGTLTFTFTTNNMGN